MKIYDIPQATKITISMVYNNQNRTVEATVLTRYGDGLLITPVYCDGRLLDIISNANFEFEESITGDKHMFQADTISRVDFAGTDFHVVTGREIVIADNQRKAERYPVQIIGNAVINHSANISVVIHDISMRGISLIVGKNSGFKIGDEVKVEFAKDANSAKMTIRGVIVREFTIGTYNAIGCEIENIGPRALSFIMDKKIEHARKSTAMAIFDAKQAAL